MATTGTINVAAKNLMLNALKNDTTYSVVATNASNTDVSNYQNISFNSASNGSMSFSGSVTLTINAGSNGANAVAKLFVVKATATSQSILEFVLDTPIDFENGGSLVVTQLDVELNDPA